jgi:peroxiredoxin
MSPTRLKNMFGGALLTLALALAPGSFAQDEAPSGTQAPSGDEASAAAPKIDPKAQEALKGLTDSLKEAKTLSYHVTASTHVEAQGMKQDVEQKQKVAVERPNKFRMEMEGMPMGLTMVSDGEKLYTYVAPMQKYQVEDAPETLDEVAGGVGGDPASGFSWALASSDPYGALMEGVSEANYVGKETINGVEAHHLAFKQADLDWDLWVSTEDKPRVVRMKPDIEAMLKAQMAGLPGADQMKVDMNIDYSDWAVNKELPADAFKFTPPAGAEEVASLQEAFGGGAPEEHALLGQNAPPFSLDLLDGSKLELAKAVENNVVVLDFWATWCGPCRHAMPIIDKVTKEFKDKGVVLYAVNLQEEPEQIKGFLDDQKLEVNVALDKEGEVGHLYQAESIPQTVIIGKGGKIEAVHVGIGPGFEDELREQLTALTSGKSLLEEGAAE